MYKQSGRDSIEEFCRLDLGSVNVVPGIKYTHPSRGIQDCVADRESRSMRDGSDGKLKYHTFCQIDRHYGPLDVDLFASQLPNQCQSYYSWRPDPFTEAIDSFLQDRWTVRGFANPSWSLIPCVLIRRQTWL